MTSALRSLTRAGLAVGLVIVSGALSGCNLPPLQPATADNTHMFESGAQVDEDAARAAETAGGPPVTHGALSRNRTQQLGAQLDQILESTLPLVRKLFEDLAAVVNTLKPPEKLATNDATLHAWGHAAREAYEAKIDLIYNEATRRLMGLEEAALAAAETQARQLAEPRAPLDPGATGDPGLDAEVTTFAEVMDGAIAMRDLAVRHQQDRSRQIDLFEVFSTFEAKGADKTSLAEPLMHGRILLFVGGDETLGAPRAVLAFRSDESKPADYHFAQVLRHRVMRGTTVVSDLGWRAAPIPAPGKPGYPQTDVLEHYLLAPQAQPIVDQKAPAFAQLRDMRIVVDIQSAVLDAANQVIGGVDWRIEFEVSARGALTWQLAGGRPQFDPWCSEVRRVLGL